MTERATYAIGDVQGCADSLAALVERLPFSPSRGDRLWFVGDLVNRGPASLAALRWIRERVDDGVAATVLGNHDLHLLAVDAAVRPLSRKDTFDDVLAAPDARELLDWVAARPLAMAEKHRLVVHAGLLPSWTAADAVSLSAEVSARLAVRDARCLATPAAPAWSPELTGVTRLATIVAGLTRTRALHADGRLDAAYKGPIDDVPADLVPWFDVRGRASAGHEVVFGHWAALGLLLRDDVVGTDTGCVWGGSLTAVRLEDRAVFSQPRVEPLT